jgi:hypothetical protein
MSSGLSRAFEPLPHNRLAAINAELDSHAFLHLLEETWLRRKKSKIETCAAQYPEAEWLTLARLNELALYLAGSYADAGMVREAGDLLVNPAIIWVALDGGSRLVKKERHTALTEQFGALAGQDDPKKWLSKNAQVVVGENPLLMELADSLEPLGHMRPGYMASVFGRHKKIAETIKLVCSLHIPEGSDFMVHLHRMPREARDYLEEGFCRFNLDLFRTLGTELSGWVEGSEAPSEKSIHRITWMKS